MTEPDFRLRGDHTTLSLDRHGRLGVFDNDVTREGASINLHEAQLRQLAVQCIGVADGLAAQAFEVGQEVFGRDATNPNSGWLGRVVAVEDGRVRVRFHGDAGYTRLIEASALRRLA